MGRGGRPVDRYGSFTAGFLNQGGALVHVYLDGTVLVSHGGTEMGQGLHTKVCQVVANEFGIDVHKVSCLDRCCSCSRREQKAYR